MKTIIRISRKLLVEASVQELAEEDVVSMIDPAIYEEIKAKDEHPLFVKMNIGKQGISKGPVIIAGIKKLWNKIWNPTRIKDLAKQLNRRVPLFVGHGKDNSTKDRRRVGEVIKGWTETIGDEVHAFAIGWIPSTVSDVQETIRNGFLDTCSLEANLLFSLTQTGKLLVDKLKELTAVTFGSSRLGQMPGFATAGVMGMVQEMESVEEVIKEALEKKGIDAGDIEVIHDEGKRGNVKVTRRPKVEDLQIDEVIMWIARMKVQPEALFSIEVLLKVPSTVDAAKNEVAEKVDAALSTKETEITDLKTVIEERDTEIKGHNDLLAEKDLKIKAAEDKAKEVSIQLQPYQMGERQTKIKELAILSPELKDVSKKKAAYIASHISISDDIALDSEGIGKAITDAVGTQLKDIEHNGITFTDKPDDDDNDDDNKDGTGGKPLDLSGWKPGDDNPLSPQKKV